jgi:glutaredoxin-related protein
MIKLTSRFTVPQVFVNEHYIGGADDFKKFTGIFPEDKKVRRWDGQKY